MRLEGPHGSGTCLGGQGTGWGRYMVGQWNVFRPRRRGGATAGSWFRSLVSPIVCDRCIQLAKSKWIEGMHLAVGLKLLPTTALVSMESH
jgi:hypothetical protein